MRWAVVIILPVVLGGCAAPRARSVAASDRVTVLEFDTTATRVSGYESASQALGLALASEVATELRRRGRAAELAPASAPVPDGGLVVRGQITTIESSGGGGLVGPRGPVASCACDGVVTTSDGARVTSFRDEQRASGTDDDTTEGPVQKCLQTIGRSVATMIDGAVRR